MTTMEYHDRPARLPVARRSRLGMLRAWFATLRRRRRQRLTWIELSRLDAHLLRDIGIDPRDVRDAFNGRVTSILFEPIRSYDNE